jgi:hypothetical protein
MDEDVEEKLRRDDKMIVPVVVCGRNGKTVKDCEAFERRPFSRLRKEPNRLK